MKLVAMIPARLGSKRVKNKNLRLIGGKPLISYVIESAIKSDIFDEIFINSEADIFKEIADDYGISFYNRPEYLSNDDVTNDLFAEDFIKNIKCDNLIQLLATSPFISVDDIRSFTNIFLNDNYETLISVTNVQIECIYDNSPINFNQKEITLPSQDLKPIQAYACGLMGWNAAKYIDNMNKYKSAYHGGDGKTGFYSLSGFSTIDIDTESDFLLAELVHNHINRTIRSDPQYYDSTKHRNISVETDTSSSNYHDILLKDGVDTPDFLDSNYPVINIDALIHEFPLGSSWAKRLVNTENNSATLICQNPGEGNRRHYHPDWNEWWYIVDGEWKWDIEDDSIIVKKGDLVFIEKGKSHQIHAIGNKPAIRLAVSREDVAHVYVGNDANPRKKLDE